MPHRIPFINQPSEFPTQLAILNNAPHFDRIYGISLLIDADWVHTAYRRGLFPWYSEGQPVLWHSPDPRMVLPLDDFRCTHSLKKRLKQWARQPSSPMRITLNHDFEGVINRCASTRRVDQSGTWITNDLKAAYIELHRRQEALSVEVWRDDELVAGLYGVLIGKMFFGESMFTTITDGSKAALACWVNVLKSQGGGLIDCQQVTQHLTNLGGAPISREVFFVRSSQLMQQSSIDWATMSSMSNLLDAYKTQTIP
jgi:leucyl/phenylalanyl-tRNA--protein transferase